MCWPPFHFFSICTCRRDWNNPPRENSDEEEEEEGEEEEPDPDNYSRVDMDADPAELAQHFPEFPGAAAALTVEIDACAAP